MRRDIRSKLSPAKAWAAIHWVVEASLDRSGVIGTPTAELVPQIRAAAEGADDQPERQAQDPSGAAISPARPWRENLT